MKKNILYLIMILFFSSGVTFADTKKECKKLHQKPFCKYKDYKKDSKDSNEKFTLGNLIKKGLAKQKASNKENK